ncbi:hypothetical protein ANTPLA_LOCUS4054 [Anthophora plagiata]
MFVTHARRGVNRIARIEIVNDTLPLTRLHIESYFVPSCFTAQLRAACTRCTIMHQACVFGDSVLMR